jgi:hypothetical protein
MSQKKITRRSVITALAGIAGSAIFSTSESSPAEKPLVGAIRWDAWYDPADGRVAAAVERALGPHRYHHRMPFFGTETGYDSVRINGASQSIIDQEIFFAADAGIDYWAFDSYAPVNPLSTALKLYLTSSRRSTIQFCMIGSIANGGTSNRYSDTTMHDISMMSEIGYVKVIDGRPLYYILSASDNQITSEWGGVEGVAGLISFIQDQVRKTGLKQPYIVLLHGDPERDATLARQIGCDAIGSYVFAKPRIQASFHDLVVDVEKDWDEQEGTGMQVVPIVMTGWDQRPLIENPPFWVSNSEHKIALDQYYRQGSPQEIAQHLRDALWWVDKHKSAAARTLLIYAWNECAEGFGALIPTFRPASETPDTSRLTAVRSVLRK